MPNDSVSSIKVGSGVTATLFSDACFGGRSESFTSNDSSLSGNTIGNDSVSSIRLTAR
jgi:hypothetical protein